MPYEGEFEKSLAEFREKREASFPFSFLTKEERAEAQRYFQQLGRGDARTQLAFFSAQSTRLNALREQSAREAKARGERSSCSSFERSGSMDISVIFKLAAIGIVITVVCQVLKKSDRDDIATVVSIVGLVIVLTVAVTMIGDLFSAIQEIFGVS